MDRWTRIEKIGEDMGRQMQQGAGSLASQTGVSPSMMSLAEKMQDPAF
jgi:hypothetical protein